MNLLALDTSTDTLSLAVERSGTLWQHQGPGGAQSSSTLLPALLRLLEQAQLHCTELDAIVFGQGPGSFTGLRTACSVAQGLAFAANIPVLPIDTLLAVAEAARVQHAATHIVATLDARMGEVYHAAWAYQEGVWQPQGVMGLSAPHDVPVPQGFILAGNAHHAYGPHLAPQCPDTPRLDALPDASALLRLAPHFLARQQAVSACDALPLYVRDKVAQTTAERLAARA